MVLRKFKKWVDSFGPYAGDSIQKGMVIGGMVLGLLTLVAAVVMESPVLLFLGFLVAVGHLIYRLAVL